MNEDGTVLTYLGLNIYDSRAETFKLIFPDIAYNDNHGVVCYNVYATLGILQVIETFRVQSYTAFDFKNDA